MLCSLSSKMGNLWVGGEGGRTIGKMLQTGWILQQQYLKYLKETQNFLQTILFCKDYTTEILKDLFQSCTHKTKAKAIILTFSSFAVSHRCTLVLNMNNLSKNIFLLLQPIRKKIPIKQLSDSDNFLRFTQP